MYVFIISRIKELFKSDNWVIKNAFHGFRIVTKRDFVIYFSHNVIKLRQKCLKRARGFKFYEGAEGFFFQEK